MPTSKRGATAVLLLAIALLAAGILAALTHEDSKKTATTASTTTTTPRSTSTTKPATSTTAGSGATSTTKPTTATTLKGTTTVPALATTTTTVKPAVPSPEQAANGLVASYRAGERTAALQFATPEVVDTLFAQPYSAPDPTFQGCAADGELFRCHFGGGDTTYDMTVERNPGGDGSYIVSVISITRPVSEPTTTVIATTSTTGPTG